MSDRAAVFFEPCHIGVAVSAAQTQGVPLPKGHGNMQPQLHKRYSFCPTQSLGVSFLFSFNKVMGLIENEFLR